MARDTWAIGHGGDIIMFSPQWRPLAPDMIPIVANHIITT